MITPKTFLARILFFLYLAAVAFLCFMHVDKLPDVQKFIFGIPTDKIAHFLMFLPFPILAYLAYDHLTNKLSHAFLFALGTLIFGLLLAYGTEYIQGKLPYRSMDIRDFKADALAIALSTAAVFIVDITHLKVRKQN
ncbi:MAG: VanZ family protein [Bacteroidales bacterium]|jgi:VanZ family protein|nr:VanZ family protein [Bacteroidales bacterium]